ncbi:DUF2799 domain-containing protein [Orrella sp. 11846]|uniref:DUF2799 domain-containing protein n=1 Tax=Orrella sp. 11846 TaxID=3409913 RepID=UPI003B5C944F
MKPNSTSVRPNIDSLGTATTHLVDMSIRLIRPTLVGAVALLLSACASMSEKECLSANWLDQGYRDGRTGRPASLLEDHREACAKAGVTPNTQQYHAGRNQGLLEYCTPANAIHEGRQGRSYGNVCPMHLERQFLTNHQRGYRAYEAQQNVDRLYRDLQRAERDLNKEKDEKKRSELRQKTQHLDSRLSRARQDLHSLERQLYHYSP